MTIVIEIFTFWLITLVYLGIAVFIKYKLDDCYGSDLVHKLIAFTWAISIPLIAIITPIVVLLYYIFKKTNDL